MMEQWIEKMRAWGKKSKSKEGGFPLVAWFGIAGMILILCSELFATDTKQQITATATSNLSGTATSQTIEPLETYRQSLEVQLSSLIAQLDGVGEVAVMITLETSEEVIYATNTQEGGDNAIKEHVLLQDGSALSEKVVFPTVAGVAVVCEGGDKVVVEAKIINLVSALFNLSTNHISVEKMN